MKYPGQSLKELGYAALFLHKDGKFVENVAIWATFF